MPSTDKKKTQHALSGTLSIASTGDRLTLLHWAPSRGRTAQRRPAQSSSRRTIRQRLPVFLSGDGKKNTQVSRRRSMLSLCAAIFSTHASCDIQRSRTDFRGRLYDAHVVSQPLHHSAGDGHWTLAAGDTQHTHIHTSQQVAATGGRGQNGSIQQLLLFFGNKLFFLWH